VVLAIRNNRHGTSSSSRSRQLGVQPPGLLSRPDPDGLECSVSNTKRDEVVVVLVNELLQCCDLSRARHLRVGEAATGFVGDGLDGREDRVDEVGLLGKEQGQWESTRGGGLGLTSSLRRATPATSVLVSLGTPVSVRRNRIDLKLVVTIQQGDEERSNGTHP
jgi:hypothetical protein